MRVYSHGCLTLTNRPACRHAFVQFPRGPATLSLRSEHSAFIPRRLVALLVLPLFLMAGLLRAAPTLCCLLDAEFSHIQSRQCCVPSPSAATECSKAPCSGADSCPKTCCSDVGSDLLSTTTVPRESHENDATVVVSPTSVQMPAVVTTRDLCIGHGNAPPLSNSIPIHLRNCVFIR